ncbi:TonB-dependent receptor [Cognaticolwellia beringensis]|uniref:TonB-dependent receptor n=1 Tax=Cognaticolwellia beringensis TaxID=1967665 RepID=A0A222G5P2_9GAMM|nr:TonB-dependent receptor [Cognaticolwellia beringensis]ASP47237.1 TonB-dependent receptor [Cognaticolwellia beringensis]
MKRTLTFLFICASLPTLGDDMNGVENISIYGQTPLSTNDLAEESTFGSVQTINAESIAQSQAISLAEHMKNKLTSLHINDIQNNPFQPDVQYRGFTASPLLGLPQGISVYLNGVRFNEPFGDTVNWDLIPLAALDKVALFSGSNPAFGQNTLGGALALTTKNGFSYTKHELEGRFGSFGQQQFTVQSGGNKGNWGYYIIANRYKEDGWRDYSESELKQFLATLSYADEDRTVDFTYSANNNQLLGNGAVPEILAELAGRSAIYTQPDKTHTRFQQFSIKSDSVINEQMSWQGNVYYRKNKINSINGDDSDYEECESGALYSLCEEDENDELERVHFVGFDEDTWLSELRDIDADDVDGTYNTGFTDNESYGVALQWVRLSHFDATDTHAALDNEFIFGLGIDKADISFRSDTEFAVLHNDTISDDRSVTGIGLYDMESRVKLEVSNKQQYFYFLNTLSIGEDLTLNLAGRYNHTHISMQDQIESGPGSLNGEHYFNRFNPAISVNYLLTPEYTVKLSYSESSRAPSPAELSCADEEDPCKLPNAFVADPPLEQVVAKTVEAALEFKNDNFSALATVFSTMSYQDIIFQQAGNKSNQGYFINLDKTQRQGIELAASTQINSVDLGASYNYLNATFESSFVSFSPVNPLGANRQVEVGDNIPGQPQHQLKFHANWQFNDALNMGTEMLYASSSYYRGDEANENKKIPSYAVTNIYFNYQITQQLRLSAKVDNLFDRQFDTFGTYGEADEVLEEIYPDTVFDEYFVGPSRPRSASISINYQF